MQTLVLLGVLIVFLVPAAGAIGLLWCIDRVQRARDERVFRQAAVTHAIHRELGPVVAPVMKKRPWGPWQLQLVVPLECPSVVESVLRVARGALESLAPARYEIILVPRIEPARARH